MNGPWQVVRQRETMWLHPDTQEFGRVVEVTFKTSDGSVGTVRVPVDMYNADNVRAAIEEYAAHIAAVANLAGEVG